MTDHDFVCWLRGFMTGIAGIETAGGIERWATVRAQLAAVGPQSGSLGQPRMPSVFNPAYNPGQVFGPIIGRAQ